MKEIIAQSDNCLSPTEVEKKLQESLEDISPKRVLLIPPDITRSHSGAGEIAGMYYQILQKSAHVDVLPALGTHLAMTEEECQKLFQNKIPFSALLHHNWRSNLVKLGEIPADYVKSISDGLFDISIPVEINRQIVEGNYDIIISIGQVVPHEVVGMANYTKNVVVGCGGMGMIHNSHMLGALWGIERLMGKDHSPVRRVFDYAEEKFLAHLPIHYVLTVKQENDLCGLFIGKRRYLFEQAVALSQKTNILTLEKPVNKVIVYLEPGKYKSTWLGNKAVYRTRRAIADGGELVVVAPGVHMFGEDPEIDQVIRKFGYCGRGRVLELYKSGELTNLAVAAHLIHGSTDGRFSVTYAVENLSSEEIEGVNYRYMSFKDAENQYSIASLEEGYNQVSGENVYFINNPAKALWIS